MDSPNLRSATEEDVEVALKSACFSLPITTPGELVKAYNCILDVLGVPDEEGDVYGVSG
jgi:hypothetical protein